MVLSDNLKMQHANSLNFSDALVNLPANYRLHHHLWLADYYFTHQWEPFQPNGGSGKQRRTIYFLRLPILKNAFF